MSSDHRSSTLQDASVRANGGGATGTAPRGAVPIYLSAPGITRPAPASSDAAAGGWGAAHARRAGPAPAAHPVPPRAGALSPPPASASPEAPAVRQTPQPGAVPKHHAPVRGARRARARLHSPMSWSRGARTLLVLAAPVAVPVWLALLLVAGLGACVRRAVWALYRFCTAPRRRPRSYYDRY